MKKTENLQETEALTYFSRLIESEIGMVFDEDQYFQLRNRLESLCTAFKFENIQSFYQQTRKGLSSEMKTALLDIATNNETSFFRDKKVFDRMYKDIIGRFSSQSQNVRIWSVASSSGQEAYSIAMLFEEWQEKNNKQVDYQIVGTDISTEILKRAEEARYSDLEAKRGLSEEFLLKYLDKTDDEKMPWRIKKQLRDRVEFRQLNLLDQSYGDDKYDFVLCRNVLIYQNRKRKKEILQRISAHMRPGGILIMGSGETLHGLTDEFEVLLREGALFFQKKLEIFSKEVA